MTGRPGNHWRLSSLRSDPEKRGANCAFSHLKTAPKILDLHTLIDLQKSRARKFIVNGKSQNWSQTTRRKIQPRDKIVEAVGRALAGESIKSIELDTGVCSGSIYHYLRKVSHSIKFTGNLKPRSLG